AGHPGFWVSLENAVVGPLIAIVSFVCSVGNIPLAAVLWGNGISFGGVIAFIFADLVTVPMVLVYREYYGWKPALVYAAYLLVTIIVVGLMVDGLFRWVGLAPAGPTVGPGGISEIEYFAWDYTTWLNLVFLPLGGALYWLGTRATAVAGGEGDHGGERDAAHDA
ncbi:MAG: permease, partial [Gemmatimonadota bacterium]